MRRGVRFTVTPGNIDGLSDVLALVLRENIERFCLYHLVPSGRGGNLYDITPEQRREVLHRVFVFAEAFPQVEVLTVDNPSDGVALAHWLEERDPERAATRTRDAEPGTPAPAAAPASGIGCVDERGDVHPDQFSRHRTLGNIREMPFSEIWQTGRTEWLQQMRSEDRPMAPMCQACPDLALCGGGMRARAELATGDPWGADPSCSLVRRPRPSRDPQRPLRGSPPGGAARPACDLRGAGGQRQSAACADRRRHAAGVRAIARRRRGRGDPQGVGTR